MRTRGWWGIKSASLLKIHKSDLIVCRFFLDFFAKVNTLCQGKFSFKKMPTSVKIMYKNWNIINVCEMSISDDTIPINEYSELLYVTQDFVISNYFEYEWNWMKMQSFNIAKLLWVSSQASNFQIKKTLERLQNIVKKQDKNWFSILNKIIDDKQE